MDGKNEIQSRGKYQLRLITLMVTGAITVRKTCSCFALIAIH